MSHDDDSGKSWTLLTGHGHVLVEIARNPHARIRDISPVVGLTERTVQAIVADLEAAGYLTRTRIGRRTRYTVNSDSPFRHKAQEGLRIGPVLDQLTAMSDADTPSPKAARQQRRRTRGQRLEPNLLIRRNLHARPRPATMRAYLPRLAKHFASFVVVERSRKAKIRPLELPTFWLQTVGTVLLMFCWPSVATMPGTGQNCRRRSGLLYLAAVQLNVCRSRRPGARRLVCWRERAFPRWGFILSPSATLRVAGQSPRAKVERPAGERPWPGGFGLLGLSWLMASGWASTTPTKLLPGVLGGPVHP